MSKNNSIDHHPRQKTQLRSRLNARRRQLSTKQLHTYSLQIARQLRRCKPLRSAQTIAIYHPINGEAPTSMVNDIFPNARLFLPKVMHYQRRLMCFTPVNNTRKTTNRWGIIETSAIRNYHWASQLDVIIVPLVAFDSNGNRLGMGGGFYDTALFNKQSNKKCVAKRPTLIGLAYDFQYIDTLPTEPWDIPLDVVVTNQQVIYN